MTDYAIGDIQGCYERLLDVLAKVGFSPSRDRLWVAGEREFETRRQNEADGIPLNEVTLGDIAVSAQELGVDTAVYEWLPA